MIVATAGHVDHGKTTLVRALTGMETDRLEEEKRRGLSINLGYAWLPTATGHSVGFIDVPGHSRFINNMIAGVNGIDLGLLVIAADDGPMPQTREHLTLMRLLGVSRYVVVLTKIDRVDSLRLDALRLSVQALVDPEALFAVSALTGEGVQALKDHLQHSADTYATTPTQGHFRLSADRSFLIKGVGLVVTGTALAGTVRTGDTLHLMPLNIPLRVRSLQVQETQCEQASAGQRCALNLSGPVHLDKIERGDWLVHPALATTTQRFDVKVELCSDCPVTLRHMSPVRLYIGAKRVAARLALLQHKSLKASDTTFAQLLVERGVTICHGDPFVLRDDSELLTLGGGRVLDPDAPERGRARAARISLLQAMDNSCPETALKQLLKEQQQSLNWDNFITAWNLDPAASQRLLDSPLLLGQVTNIRINGDSYLLAKQTLERGQRSISELLERETLEKNTLNRNLNTAFPGVAPGLLITHALQCGTLVVTPGGYRLVQNTAPFAREQLPLWISLEALLQRAGRQLPAAHDLCKQLNIATKPFSGLVATAIKAHWLLRVSDTRFALPQTLLEIAHQITELDQKHNHFSVAEFKNHCDVGRNTAVELLEYFDRIGFTVRRASKRAVLNPRAINQFRKSDTPGGVPGLQNQ